MHDDSMAQSNESSSQNRQEQSKRPSPKNRQRGFRRFRRLSSLPGAVKNKTPLRRRQREAEPQEVREEPTAPSAGNIRTAILSTSKAIVATNGVNDCITTRPQSPDNNKVAKAPNNNLLCNHASCATAILQHSFLAQLCGCGDFDVDEDSILLKYHLPDDPTIQESIECIFAHQLEEGLPHFLCHEEENDEPLTVPLTSPTTLHQSRSSRELSTTNTSTSSTKAPRPTYTRKTSGSLVHVGTFDPTVDTRGPPTRRQTFPVREKKVEAIRTPTALTPSAPAASISKCACQKGIKTPLLPPKDWSQRPLLLRPTPGSGTTIRGIRFSRSQDYLWTPNDKNKDSCWPSRLQQHWNNNSRSTTENDKKSSNWNNMCDECMILPINNGNEKLGETLVVDFRSDLFCGSLLLRIRGTNGTTPQPFDDSKGYFAGMNRRYQVVVKGKFLEKINLTECVTGFCLERPCGKMPAKWIVKSGLKVVTFFAPQLRVKLDGPQPSSVSPLGSTPQVLAVHPCKTEGDYKADGSIEDVQEEPELDQHTLLGTASDAPTSLARARFRKKTFDKAFVEKVPFVVDTDKVYTFEFLQHMLYFQDFSVEMGSFLGSITLGEVLDGQPLQIMASCEEKKKKLWSFDIWHECLVETSKMHDAAA